MNRTRVPFVAACLLPFMLLTGCSSTRALSRDQLFTVAGIHPDESRTLLTESGETSVSGGTKVRILRRGDGDNVSAPLAEMKVQDNQLVLYPTTDAIRLDKEQVAGAETKVFSVGKTIALTAAITVGVLVVIAIGLLAAGGTVTTSGG
jgi:hypothetical protein